MLSRGNEPVLPLFRRMILGLHPGAIDQDAVELVAEIANLLGVVLQGVFIEDEAVSAIGSFAPAREFQLIQHDWRPIEMARLTEDMRLAASSAKRLLEEISQRLGITSLFEVIRGDPGSMVLRMAQPSDILVVAAPKNPHDRLSASYSEAVFLRERSVSAILLPRQRKPRKGPIIALVKTPEDRGLTVAAAIAGAAKERLLVVAQSDNGRLQDAILAAAGVAGLSRASTDFLALPRPDMLAFLAATERVKERLIVLQRSEDNDYMDMDPFMLASTRQSPVILVGPEALAEAPRVH